MKLLGGYWFTAPPCPEQIAGNGSAEILAESAELNEVDDGLRTREGVSWLMVRYGVSAEVSMSRTSTVTFTIREACFANHSTWPRTG